MTVPLPPWAQDNSYFAGFDTLRIVDEWDTTKNDLDGFSIEDPAISFTAKLHWKCQSFGHEWMESIDSRRLGSDCPYCTKTKMLVGFNDLGSVKGMDDMLQEWDYVKNKGLTPKDVLVNSKDSVHWRCLAYGHEWKSMVKNRVNGAGCPTCSGKKLLKGFNDLASLEEYDAVVAQWHPTRKGTRTPTNTPFGYSGKLWWRCPDHDDHEWVTTLNHHIKGNGCLICAAEFHKETCRKEMFDQTFFEFTQTKVPVTLDTSAILALFNEKYIKDGDTIILPVDAYNAELKIVVIFDDQFNHGEFVPNTSYRSIAFGKDYDETIYLLNAGYKLIRIREHAIEGKLDIHSFDNVGRLNSLSLRDNLVSVPYKSFGENEGDLGDIIGKIIRKKSEWFK